MLQKHNQLLAYASCLIMTVSAASAEWQISAGDLLSDTQLADNSVEIRQAGDDVYSRGAEWIRFTSKENGIQADLATPPQRQNGPNGIPHGYVATNETAETAWYEGPTDRYQHGALGDIIEAGTLAFRIDGKTLRFDLPQSQVFEDIAPRFADIDGNGTQDFVTIRSDLKAGAAIAVYTVQDNKIVELVATQPIGLANRWLNIAGIADFNGDGALDIAQVIKPHLTGNLQILTFEDGKLRILESLIGLSNHINGTTELDMSAVADVDGDSVMDLILPTFGQGSLVAYSFKAGPKRLFSVETPTRISTAIGFMMTANSPTFLFGDGSGKLVAVENRQ